MTTARRQPQPADAAMSERQLLEAVRKFAGMYDWKFYHTFDSRRSTPGFPDCILASAKHDYALAIELKREAGRVTVPQLEWLALLHGRRLRSRIVRPSDLEALRRELAGEEIEA